MIPLPVLLQYGGSIASITGTSIRNAGKGYNAILDHLAKKWDDEFKHKYCTVVPSILSAGKHIEALEEFYTTEDLDTAGLTRLRIQASGDSIPTGIVSMQELKALKLNVTDCQYDKLRNGSDLRKLDAKHVLQSLYEEHIFGLSIWNQPIYRLLEVGLKESQLTISFSTKPGEDFFRYRVGAGALEQEILQGLVETNGDVKELCKRREELLARRVVLLPDAKAVACFSKRMCVGGIHAVIAIFREEENDYVIPIQRRSKEVAGGQGLLGPIPEAYHQPMISSEEERDFMWTFRRELYEELMGGIEVERKTKHLCYDWYMGKEPLASFMKEQPHLEITGFGFNLVSGNYEVTMLCVVQNGDFWSNHKGQLITNWEASLINEPFLSTSQEDKILDIIRRKDWTGSGLYSVARGLKRLSEIDPDRVKLPDIRVTERL